MKIDKLTKEQEKQIPEYIEKWINKASEPMDIDKAKLYTKKMYKKMGEKEPIIIIGDSPLNTAMLASLFFVIFKKDKSEPIYSHLSSQLRSQLYSQLDSQLDSQLYSQLSSQLDSQLYSQLDSQLYSQLYSQLSSQLKEINSDWYLGLWWLIWCGWYDFAKSIGVSFDNDKYDLFINFNLEVHFIIPYKNIAFISHKPTEIHWKNRLLHNDNGMSVKYKDGYGMYNLNGVTMPERIVKTPANEIPIEWLVKEKNVEIRSEIQKKIGIKTVFKKLQARTIEDISGEEAYKKYPIGSYYQHGDVLFKPKTITHISFGELSQDMRKRLKQVTYKLLELDLNGLNIKALYMTNPSVKGEEHIEYVDNGANSVLDAFKFRNNENYLPMELS